MPVALGVFHLHKAEREPLRSSKRSRAVAKTLVAMELIDAEAEPAGHRTEDQRAPARPKMANTWTKVLVSTPMALRQVLLNASCNRLLI